MNKLYTLNVKTTAAIVAITAIVFLLMQINASAKNIATLGNNLTSYIKDTTPTNKAKPIVQNDTAKRKIKDSNITTIDTLTISKDSLSAPIKYSAEDSGVLIVDTKEFILYGKAKTEFEDMELEANTIQYQQDKQIVKAKGSADTSANAMNKTKFKQGEMTTLSDSIIYSLKTQKGVTYNTYYQEGELFVNAAKLKKADSNVVYAYRGSFTTCNLDTPHFTIRTKKMKIINNKIGVSGPAHPEFEGVPVPIYVPFGIYPLNRSRHSGVLVPTFSSSEDFGLGLEGLGYYKVLNDNFDVTVRTNLYSYGGWNMNTNSKYIKRYKYSGSFNLALQRNKTLNRYSSKLQNEFTESSSYMITWGHSRDNRARPGTSFSANVNFGSSKFNSGILNNPYQNFNNQLASSIAYTKMWGNGKYNLSLNANHDQNNNTKVVNLTLPNGSFTMNTVYPFQKKESIGAGKWYEKLGIGYSTNFQNRISYYDTAFSVQRILDTIQWGADHSIPISLSLPSLGPINIAPSVSFTQRWFGQTLMRQWDASTKSVKTVIQRGLFTQSNMTFGIGANTRIFGTYNLKNKSNTQIRHELRPNISFGYKPDLVSKDFYNVQVDSTNRYMRISKYDGGLYGSFSEGNFGGIGFGVDNLLEMKVKDKTDTSKSATKKVRLIDGFGFNSSYNLMADSFALGNFSMYFRSTLFEKINITANANLDPYDTDEFGMRKKNLMIKNGKLGRFTSGSLAVSTSFTSGSKDKSKKDNKSNNNNVLPNDPFMTAEEQRRQLEYTRQNPAEFTDFNIPWRIDLSYSLSFNRILKPDFSGYRTDVFSSISFNGDFSLTPKWKAGATGYYDVSSTSLQQFSMFVSREMHCWQLSINVTPIGLYRSFNFTISPKSGILRDLRINRSRTFSNQ